MRSAAARSVLILYVDGRHDYVERRDGRGPAYAGFVVVQLDGRSENALDTYSVAPHDDRYVGSIRKQNSRAHALGVLGSELEDVADLDRFEDVKRAAAVRAGLAGFDRAKARPFVNFDVAIDRHSAKVVVVLVRAGGHVCLPCRASSAITRKIFG